MKEEFFTKEMHWDIFPFERESNTTKFKSLGKLPKINQFLNIDKRSLRRTNSIKISRTDRIRLNGNYF